MMRVGLFVTCLIDAFRPDAGFAAVALLERAGAEVEVPLAQTCCGQPAWNNGDREDARAVARQVMDAFEGFDAVVVPSASCAGMLKRHYPALFAHDPACAERAEKFAATVHELSGFLVDVLGWTPADVACPGRVALHDSCSALREMGVRGQPRRLLDAVAGTERVELEEAESCCGFGGTFCVKYPEISTHMVSARTRAVRASGAQVLCGVDLGCLLNIAGRLRREGSKVRVYHLAEVLAGYTDRPGLGEKAPR